MVEVEIEVPEKLKMSKKELTRSVESSLKDELTRKLLLRRLDELLKGSKLSREECIELGREVKI